MRKYTLLLVACLMLTATDAQAQIGSVLRKAAQKTTERLTDKAAEKAADAATRAIENQLDKTAPQADNPTATPADAATCASLMAQMPTLPTVQQLASYKEAEFNGQTLKMMVSPVTAFNAKLSNLSLQALTLSTANADSAQIVDAAYKNAQLATGLTREELDHLASLPDDQQQAYLQAHYKNGTAEAALLNQAADASQYLEPLQPLIDQWETLNAKIEQIHAQAETLCKDIYRQYTAQLANSSAKDRNKLLIKYYTQILPHQLAAVQQAQDVILREQLPIAEQIEQKIAPIRAQRQDLFSALLNYPQLTATQFFAEPARLLEIPEYTE